MTIVWTKKAEHALASMDRQIARRLRAKVDRWADTGSGEWSALTGVRRRSRLRAGKWRVILSQHDNGTVYVVDVDNRDSAYD